MQAPSKNRASLDRTERRGQSAGNGPARWNAPRRAGGGHGWIKALRQTTDRETRRHTQNAGIVYKAARNSEKDKETIIDTIRAFRAFVEADDA